MNPLTFTAKNIADAALTTTGCAIVPIFGRGKLPLAAQQLDQASNGAIKAAIKLGDFRGETGEKLMLPGAGASKRILLVGCGVASKFDRGKARQFSTAVYTAINQTRAKDAVAYIAELSIKNGDASWLCHNLAQTLTAASYRYTNTVTKPKAPFKLAKLTVCPGKSISIRSAQRALDTGRYTGLGVNHACELANLPGNVCTPGYLVGQARKLVRDHPTKLKLSVIEEKKMSTLGMGALLSVSAGSAQPAKLIVLNYTGADAKHKPYILVGKGITFDSGGISLKPGAKMDEMKYDMGGAASVFGTLSAISKMELPLNVIGIIAAAENMPGSRATKPGDVVTSMSGKTIEILNTDAEGRLVLCDALTYAERFNPKAVIDIATLTGACVVALGSHATGLYSNQDKLSEQLLEAGIEAHDRAWQMPLWDDYKKQLKTNFADLSNIGGPGGGSITAACFLSSFAEKYPWAHLDIAGTAWTSGPKGATGRPVAMLTQYLMDRAGK
ncbi:MAG: leucyl aminopeptidase [Halieaceae bacterium]|nr:leucyl aminopeptidase [Halieaceae bacterium]